MPQAAVNYGGTHDMGKNKNFSLQPQRETADSAQSEHASVRTFLGMLKLLRTDCISIEIESLALFEIDLNLRRMFLTEHAYLCFQEFLQRKLPHDALAVITDSFQLTYYFFKTDLEGRLRFFRIGPFLTEKMNRKRITDILKKNGLPMDFLAGFTSYYGQFVPLEAPELFERTLLALTREVFGKQVCLERFPGTLLSCAPAEQQPETCVMDDTIENFYILENQLMEAVSQGDSEKALSAFRTQEHLTFFPRSVDEVVDYHGKLTVLNVLCRKAIEKAGVHPIHIDTISSRISRQVITEESVSILRGMSEKIIQEYCRFAAEYASKKYHPLVESCILYIDRHFNENPSLADLALRNYVSKQYLSVLFRKETGQNITAYVHARQLAHAAELLRSTSQSVEEIANQCGQGNVSYFTKMFKEHFGISPREYRKSTQDDEIRK